MAAAPLSPLSGAVAAAASADGVQVLEESAYLDSLGRIIRRDFFASSEAAPPLSLEAFTSAFTTEDNAAFAALQQSRTQRSAQRRAALNAAAGAPAHCLNVLHFHPLPLALPAAPALSLGVEASLPRIAHGNTRSVHSALHAASAGRASSQSTPVSPLLLTAALPSPPSLSHSSFALSATAAQSARCGQRRR